ncbi:MAG: B12-binding domain-containing radical SAM protein [Chloroflexota bacterium]
MRILLVQPGWGQGMGFHQLSLAEPLALETLAGGLVGHDVRLLDLRVDNSLLQTLKEFRPQLVGIHCSFTIDVYKVQRIAATAKETMGSERPFVIVGGHHATLNPGDFARTAVDAVAIGEGEITLAELVGSLEAGRGPEKVAGLALNTPEGQVFTDPRPMVDDMDSLPQPNRELTRRYWDSYYLFNYRHMAVVETTRGCPYRCHFCAVWCFYKGTVRYRSPERVVDEVLKIREPNVLFCDDNFLADPERAEQIALLLRERGSQHHYLFQARTDSVAAHPDLLRLWKSIGLDGVFLGMEKISDTGLEGINKNNSAANNEAAVQILGSMELAAMGSFIADPDWDHADFQALRDYVETRHIYSPSFSVLTPLPGTVLYRRVRKQLLTDNYDMYDLLHAILPTKMPLYEFYQEFSWLFKSGYKPGRLTVETLRVIKSGVWLEPGGISHLRQIGLAAFRLADPESYLLAHRQDQHFAGLVPAPASERTAS